MEWTKKVYCKIRKRPIKFCLDHNISSDWITLTGHFVALTMGCYLFSRGTYLAGVLGLLICGINVLLDYLDGDVARAGKKDSSFGEWIDSKFDIIMQSMVLGAIAIGCFKSGMNVVWIIILYINVCGNNVVGLQYNHQFGFSCGNGNELFRKYMDTRPHIINICFKNIIDPTASFPGLALMTARYFIAFGIIFNIMPFAFMCIAVIGNIRWIIMFVLYGMHLKEKNNLHVLNALSILDEERQEHYEL